MWRFPHSLLEQAASALFSPTLTWCARGQLGFLMGALSVGCYLTCVFMDPGGISTESTEQEEREIEVTDLLALLLVFPRTVSCRFSCLFCFVLFCFRVDGGVHRLAF